MNPQVAHLLVWALPCS